MTKYPDPEGFAEWETTVPESVRRDPIWRTPAYRYALWLSDLAKQDARVLRANADTRSDVDQFLRAVGSISANLAEGYSRRTGAERARYYDYARATAREAKDWYFKGRAALGEALVAQRHALLERIIRILTAVIPREREDGSRRRRTRRDDGTRMEDGEGPASNRSSE
jgi:four helix bundle protein